MTRRCQRTRSRSLGWPAGEEGGALFMPGMRLWESGAREGKRKIESMPHFVTLPPVVLLGELGCKAGDFCDGGQGKSRCDLVVLGKVRDGGGLWPGSTESRPTIGKLGPLSKGKRPTLKRGRRGRVSGIGRTSGRGNRRRDNRSASGAGSSRDGDGRGFRAGRLCRNGPAGNGSVPRRNRAGPGSAGRG